MKLYEHLSATDAGVLALEKPPLGRHVIQIVYLFEGPAPSLDEVRAALDSGLAQFERFRQCIAEPPLKLGRPAWVPDHDFKLGRHVFHTSVASPGTDAELRALSDELNEQPLDLGRPPWQVWLVDGFADDRFAIIQRIHHSLADGVSTQAFASALFGGTETRTTAPSQGGNEQPPTPAGLLLSSLADDLRTWRAGARSAARLLRTPVATATALTSSVGPVMRAFGVVETAPATPFNQAIGTRRRTLWLRVPIADLRATSSTFETTMNNVVLAAVAGGLNRYFTRCGIAAAPVLRTLVPVSVRRSSDRSALGNQLSAIYPRLPIGDMSPAARIAEITGETSRLMRTERPAVLRAMELTAFMPRPLAAAVHRRLHAGHRLHNLAVSNIPGSRHALNFGGRPLLEILPSSLTMPRHGLNIAMVSYLGTMFIGVCVDPDLVPDADLLTADLAASFGQLTEYAAPEVTGSEATAS